MLKSTSNCKVTFLKFLHIGGQLRSIAGGGLLLAQYCWQESNQNIGQIEMALFGKSATQSEHRS
jgi:hypothetical protein